MVRIGKASRVKVTVKQMHGVKNLRWFFRWPTCNLQALRSIHCKVLGNVQVISSLRPYSVALSSTQPLNKNKYQGVSIWVKCGRRVPLTALQSFCTGCQIHDRSPKFRHSSESCSFVTGKLYLSTFYRICRPKRAEMLSPDVFLGHREGTEFLLLYFLNFMFYWPCTLVRLWVNDQLDAQLHYIKRLLL